MTTVKGKVRSLFKNIYGFLPIQLLVLHFRKYQMLLLFWALLIMVITGNFASGFGAETLFLSPEYLGEVSFFSMAVVGGALAMFTMAWQITTFIINSKRIPFLGATRHAFLKYCVNNALLPLVVLIFYVITYAHFQLMNEHLSYSRLLWLLLGFFSGIAIIILLSFTYFFRLDRDILKSTLSRITNPALIREIIPYDTLDAEFDFIQAKTYLTGGFKIKPVSSLERYNLRLLDNVLRRHHRNAIFATLFAIGVLFVMGIFKDHQLLRIPAAAGFLILFSVMLGVVGAFKYFLRSWELLGWTITFLFIGWMVRKQVFDFRGTATGINYDAPAKNYPEYSYEHLKELFNPRRCETDFQAHEQILDKWKMRRSASGDTLPPLVIVCVSGGGSRAAYWTFRSLQYIDSMSNGNLFRNTVFMTGASGGMIGAAYWRSIHWKHQEGKIANAYDLRYQQNIGKDILNAIIFSFVSIDILAPFNKVSIAGHAYRKDRGYAMEEELINNTDGVLDNKIGDFRSAEASGSIPVMVFGNTIINDGRKLMISAQQLSHFTQSDQRYPNCPPVIDAVDYQTMFSRQNPNDLRVTAALRMNATFPYILPVVKLPTQPSMNVMDAGFRDNFGVETALRFVHLFRTWLQHNTRDIIVLQVRDTKEHDLFRMKEQNDLLSMAFDPLFVIHDKWESFQSYAHGYMKDMASSSELGPKLHFISLEYIPEKEEKLAALNFHLTQKEKEDLYKSIAQPYNKAMSDTLLNLLKK
jgi:hypothetical protein